MLDERVELYHEALTSLPMRLETILLIPNSHGTSPTSSSQCLPDADCSGLSGNSTHLLAPGGSHSPTSPCLPDADCSGLSSTVHHYRDLYHGDIQQLWDKLLGLRKLLFG